MSDDWKQDAAFVLMMMLGAGLAGFNWGHEVAILQFQQEAVDKGHGEYDSKTTEFKWLPVAEGQE